MQQQKEYLRIRIKVTQYKLPVGLIVDCFNTVAVKNANRLCLSQKLSVFALILGWWQQFIPFANLAHFH